MEYDKCTFMCVLLCFVSLPSIVFTQRNCPPGKFCQIGANCTSDTNFCVTRCPTKSDHHQQGNHLTGNCERLPSGTEHWMDSTFYEVFILSNQTLNTPILTISFISTDVFQTDNMTFINLPNDITFTLIGSCPYFYFTNMMKEVVSFENYNDMYLPDDVESASLALAEPVPPDDYEMEVTVTDSDNVLERRDIIVHVRDVPPCTAGQDYVGFRNASYTVYEDVGSVDIVVEIRCNKTALTDIYMKIKEMKNTAENGTDYEPGPFNVTIKKGEKSAIFQVEIYDDTVYENGNDDNGEDFSLEIIAESLESDSDIHLGSTSKTKVVIVDDEYTLSFGEGTYVFEEDKAIINLSVSRPLKENITVTLTYLDFTATGNDSTNDAEEIDYYASDVVIFPANTATINLTLNIVNDNRLEINELFRIIANPPETPTDRPASVSTDIIIRDDDDFEVTFEKESYCFNKNIDEPDIKLLLIYSESYKYSIMFPINVTVEDENGPSADNSTKDYIVNNNMVSYKEGEVNKTIMIRAIDNDTVKPYETLFLNIKEDSLTTGFSPGVPNSRVVIGEYGRVKITIVNDDGTTVSLNQSQYSVVESDNSLTGTITLSSRTSEDVIVEVTVSDGSANAVVDYAMSTALVFNVTIFAGSTSSPLSIDIINDMIQEDNETFNIAIRLLPSCLLLSLGTSSSTVMIIDDDEALITFTSSTFSGLESSGVISATIAISGGIVSSKNINIPITFIEGNASGINDFVSTMQNVTISAGTNVSTVDIRIIDDEIVERDETFNMSLTVSSSFGPGISNGTVTRATVTIIDTSVVRVMFERHQFSGSEHTGFVIINLVLVGGTSSYPFNVTVVPSELSPVSAEGGVDFNIATLIATFASGMRISNVNIALINDSIAEGYEEFNLALNVPTSLGPAITVGNISSATGVITESTTPPQIYIHPLDKTISINNDSTSTDFTCMAYGARSYSWEKDSGNIAINAEGIRSTRLELYKLLPSHSGRYRCSATNRHGTSYSKYAMLIVKALPPVVSIEPSGEIRHTEGDNIQFRCIATGVGSLDFTYQWFLNNEPIANLDTDTLFDSSISEGDTGIYTCSVLNPYKGIGRSSNAATLVLEQYCDPVIVSYDGFNITWNETLVGITAVAPCTGPGLSGNVSRRCIMDDLWAEKINCFRKKTGELRDKVAKLTMSLSELNDTEAIAEAGNIADSLANVTSAAEEPIFAADIDLAVGILTTLNNVTETIGSNLTADDPVLEGSASVLNNLLSEANQNNWQQLEDNSPATSQMLVTSAEQVTRILSITLNDSTPTAIKAKPNIILKAERVSNESLNKGYVFPDENDNLTAYTGGSAQVMVPGGLLQNLSANSSSELTISSTVIRDGTGFRLPSSNNGSAASQVPASPIFSLQIDPNPDPIILQNSPIMMMFDVSISSDDILDEEPLQGQPNSGTQNQQNFDENFEIDDVTCNFYDHDLITNDLNQVGGWSTEGLTVGNNSNKTSVSCFTTHLTSFAVLVSIQDEGPHSPPSDALSIISYIGCSISLFCLCISIIFLSYTIYKTRDKINHLFIHLNLCIALALGLIVFIAGIEQATNNEVACKFVAALLQYLFTSAFCWMLCEGVMLYMMLVTVFGNKLNSRRFFFLLGWGPAIPIVAISVGVAYKHYGTKDYCWIKSDDGAIAAFIVPIVAMMVINCVFLGITLKVLWDNRRKTMSEKVSANVEVAKDLLKAIIVLLPLLGLTWIIGIFAVNDETQAFAWIFAILNSFQGVFILIFHVLRNKQVVKEMKDQYRYISGSTVFRRMAFTSRGSGNTSTLGLSTKARTSQGSSSEVSGHGKKISTTSFGSGFGDGDYLSTTLERRLSKDKAEALEDSVCEDEKQIKMTTFRKADESIVEEQDIGVEEKQPDNDNCDVDEEDKKSITDENIEEGKKFIAKEADEEEKESSAEAVLKEKRSTKEGGPVTMERTEVVITKMPTPLPRTIK